MQFLRPSPAFSGPGMKIPGGRCGIPQTWEKHPGLVQGTPKHSFGAYVEKERKTGNLPEHFMRVRGAWDRPHESHLSWLDVSKGAVLELNLIRILNLISKIISRSLRPYYGLCICWLGSVISTKKWSKRRSPMAYLSAQEVERYRPKKTKKCAAITYLLSPA